MAMRYVRPHRVVLPVLLLDGIVLTRLIMGRGVNLVELVTSTERLTIIVDVYSDTLLIDTTVYPTLYVMRLHVHVSGYICKVQDLRKIQIYFGSLRMRVYYCSGMEALDECVKCRNDDETIVMKE